MAVPALATCDHRRASYRYAPLVLDLGTADRSGSAAHDPDLSLDPGDLYHQVHSSRRMEPVKYLSWDFLFFRIRLADNRMHNLTIVLGLVVCMSAGALTVVRDTLPGQKTKTYRLYRTVRRAGRKGKEYLIDLWN